MSSFRGVDYLHIDSLLNEQELLVRQTARQFVEDRLLPVIRDCYRESRFPRELVPEMGRLGFFGATLEGYGCAGMSNVEYGLLMQELERGDSGLRSFASVQGALVMYPLYTYGSEEQKERWLPKLRTGEALGCFRADRSRISARTWPACAPRHARMAMAGCSTAKKHGSLMGLWPTSRSCGRGPKTASADFWWRRARPDSPRPTFTASGRCGRR